MRENSQGFPLVMLFLQAGESLLPRRIVTEKQHGSFGKGPREVGVTDFLP